MTEGEYGNKAREARNQYYRAWRAANKDKVREINRRYWEKRAQKDLERKEEKQDDGK